MGSISFGLALVTGRNLVPRPATGNTAVFTGLCDMLEIITDFPRGRRRTILTLLAEFYDGVGFEAIPGMAGRTVPIKAASGESTFIASVFFRMREQCADLMR